MNIDNLILSTIAFAADMITLTSVTGEAGIIWIFAILSLMAFRH